jgi:hypothetical protein
MAFRWMDRSVLVCSWCKNGPGPAVGEGPPTIYLVGPLLQVLQALPFFWCILICGSVGVSRNQRASLVQTTNPSRQDGRRLSIAVKGQHWALVDAHYVRAPMSSA